MKQTLDFVVIGAEKSGTTSLFEYMRGHPDLHLPDAKEVPYFSHGKHVLTWQEYLEKWFAAADPAKRWGTVTPQYMVGGLYHPEPDGEHPWGDPRTVPARMRERIPDARLIAILRDPAERARSHYDWAVQAGWETQPFGEAIHDLLKAEALEAARAQPQENTGYITWGEYGRILAGYFAEFPRDSILVLYTSELKHDPAAVMRGVFAFLEVDESYVPPNLGSVYRPVATVPRHFPGLRLEKLKPKLTANRAIQGVGRVLPAAVRRQADKQYDRLDYWVDTLNRRHARTEFPHARVTPPQARSSEPQLDQALREHYEADGRLLASLVGAAPPWLGE